MERGKPQCDTQGIALTIILDEEFYPIVLRCWVLTYAVLASLTKLSIEYSKVEPKNSHRLQDAHVTPH